MINARPAQDPEYYLTPDCPMEGEGIEARWGGKGAKLLGLEDESFGSLAFLRLAKGLNPENGTKLTARLKENRRDAIDLTVTVPKSVSVLIEVAGDDRVKDALMDANAHVMRKWEKGAKVRVRKGGVSKDRESGNIVYAAFYHGTGRPVDSKDGQGAKPDPQAHIHNYVPNVSFDKPEGQWKALKRHHFDIPKIEKDFHRRLAKSLRKLGYQVTNTKNAFEVKGVSPEVCGLFNRRQDEIKAVEAKREAAGQKMTEGYRAKASQMIRQPKDKTLTREEVHRSWVSRMTGDQFSDLADATRKARATLNRSRWRSAMQRGVERLRSFGVGRDQERGQAKEKGHGHER